MEGEIIQLVENNGMKISTLKAELVDAVRFLNGKGWLPATSGNFSFRVPGENKFWISQQGIDKSLFSEADLMPIDAQGEPLEENASRPPAETMLHTLLYENPDVNAILHTHSVNATVISMSHRADGEVKLYGFELLKELSGINTHDTTVAVPVFTNMQDIKRLSLDVRRYMRGRNDVKGFLLSGHGLYSWGKTIAEAKKHIETFEFLLECAISLRIYNFKMNP